MDEVEIKRHIEEIQADLIRLKKRVETLSRQQAEMNDTQDKMSASLIDTNRESHIAKHGVLNMQANLKGFTDLFDRIQKITDSNQEGIRELLQAKKSTDEKLYKLLTWLEEFSELSTYKGWEDKFREISENTRFRLMFGSWYSGLLGMAAIFAAILAALAFSKKIGL
jgi:soluble cytochrome b562